MMNPNQKNADRFLGFASLYEQARPKMPLYPAEIITKYLNRTPDTVIDLGCGTGLSTAVWKNRCNRVIGVEPNEEMLAVARGKLTDVTFVKAFADSTGLPDGCADAVVCSQSFHWMDPERTLPEIGRILKDGGVFATVDCDWPPVSRWEAEQAYMRLMGRVDAIEKEDPELQSSFARWNKNEHLSNMRRSGLFRYYRELVFSSREDCDAQRFISLAMSQGGLQGILKRKPALIERDIEAFGQSVRSLLGEGSFTIDFSYRLCIGVK